MFPLAFASPINFSTKRWVTIAYFFTGCLCLATIWCLIKYMSDPVAVNESYLRAKTMITPLENDHVRFSLLVSIAIFICGYLWYYYPGIVIKNKIVLFFTAGWLIIFLHLLAARTGLISFYIMVLALVIKLIFSKNSHRLSFAFLGLIIFFPVLAYLFIPSFQNRVKFFLYEKEYFVRSN